MTYNISTSIAITNDKTCKNFSEQNWYLLAEKYIYYDKKLSSYGTSNCDNLLYCIEERDKAKLALINTSSPSDEDYISLLHTGIENCICVALVNILSRKENKDYLIDSIIKTTFPSNDIFVNFYTNIYLNNLPPQKLISISTEIKDYINNISYHPWLIMSLMPSLEKIPPDKSFEIYINLLKNNDTAIKLSTFITIRKYGVDYITRIKERLKQDGAHKALNFINQYQKNSGL